MNKEHFNSWGLYTHTHTLAHTYASLTQSSQRDGWHSNYARTSNQSSSCGGEQARGVGGGGEARVMCRVLNRAIWFISADRADAQEESFAVINASQTNRVRKWLLNISQKHLGCRRRHHHRCCCCLHLHRRGCWYYLLSRQRANSLLSRVLSSAPTCPWVGLGRRCAISCEILRAYTC